MHQPPLVRGRRIKLRYAHQGGRNPPVVVIHGNQTEHVPDAYRRFLENYFRKRFRLKGTPMRIEGDYMVIHDPAGRIAGHFGIQSDVSDRHRADEQLRASRQELRALAAES